MRRFLIYLVCGFWLLALGSNSTLAVEKKKKEPQKTTQKKSTAKAKKATKKKNVKKKTVEKKAAKVSRKSATTRKKYDNFIDRNKNGIDDRRERVRTKAPAKKKNSGTKVTKKTAAKKSGKSTVKPVKKTTSKKSSTAKKKPAKKKDKR